MRALAGLFVVAVTGCVSVSVGRPQATEPIVEVSPRAEDGTRYLSVHAPRRMAPQTLARRWDRAATEACEGDYLLLSETQFEQRTAGVVSGRTHEGYVRCVLPGEVDDAAPSEVEAEKANSDGEKARRIRQPRKGRKGPRTPSQRRAAR